MPVKPLTVLVVVMGIMILGGVAALAAIIIGRTTHATGRIVPFVAQPVSLPAGARIEALATDAERIVVDALLPDGSRELIVLDGGSGRLIGRIPLRAAP